MLTKQDKAWLSHLSDSHTVKIVPYDPKVKEVFKQVAAEIRSILGDDAIVEHRGATSFEISGKGDLDVYIPVTKNDFDEAFQKLKQFYGEPGSHYPLERVRWNKTVEEIDVEVFLINPDSSAWQKMVAFEDYLRSHPEALAKYRQLKENSAGLTTRQYYTRKTEFLNSILSKAKK